MVSQDEQGQQLMATLSTLHLHWLFESLEEQVSSWRKNQSRLQYFYLHNYLLFACKRSSLSCDRWWSSCHLSGQQWPEEGRKFMKQRTKKLWKQWNQNTRTFTIDRTGSSYRTLLKLRHAVIGRDKVWAGMIESAIIAVPFVVSKVAVVDHHLLRSKILAACMSLEWVDAGKWPDSERVASVLHHEAKCTTTCFWLNKKSAWWTIKCNPPYVYDVHDREESEKEKKRERDGPASSSSCSGFLWMIKRWKEARKPVATFTPDEINCGQGKAGREHLL